MTAKRGEPVIALGKKTTEPLARSLHLHEEREILAQFKTDWDCLPDYLRVKHRATAGYLIASLTKMMREEKGANDVKKS